MVCIIRYCSKARCIRIVDAIKSPESELTHESSDFWHPEMQIFAQGGNVLQRAKSELPFYKHRRKAHESRGIGIGNQKYCGGRTGGSRKQRVQKAAAPVYTVRSIEQANGISPSVEDSGGANQGPRYMRLRSRRLEVISLIFLIVRSVKT